MKLKIKDTTIFLEPNAKILTKIDGFSSYSFEISFSDAIGFININIGRKLFHFELYWTSELLAPLFG